MIRSRSSQPQTSRAALISMVAVAVVVLALPGAALARRSSPALRTVHYRGAEVRVPAGWPVIRLGAGSHVCVRFNRHALYLGRPGGDQRCPGAAIGRTEAILISPASYRGALLAPVGSSLAQTASGSMVRIRERARHLVVTATWGSEPGVIRHALGLRSLRSAVRATDRRPAPVGVPFSTARALPRITSPAAPALPGAIYNGLGFDVCTTPSAPNMAVWGESSPYAAVGIYIGGANAACLGGNLDAAWVSIESAAGWHMIPIYVGLQAPIVGGKPSSGCSGCAAMSAIAATAAAQGTAAAQDAVAQAQALGIGTGNPLYYDMENYARSATASAAVLAFLQGWTQQLHISGYQSGVYSSGSSGISDLVSTVGSTYLEPDELWTASWYSSPPPTPPTSPANSWVPSTDWINNHQLLQYYSDPAGKAETYGGVTIGIDRDYVDAPTAAFGAAAFVSQAAAAPTLTLKPQADGTIEVAPSWPGEPGITGYTLLAGPSATALAAVDTVAATAKFPVKLQGVYAYFEVQALNSLGQVVGTSVPVQTPPSVAIFGHSAYVGAKGPVGIPVACLNSSPCQLEAAIYAGKRRIAHSGISSIARHGGQLLVPLSRQTHRLVAYAANHRLPVTVTLTGSSGARAARPLNLIPYTASGRPPVRRTWPGAAIQILAETSFVSNAWTGGVLAVCNASVPCVATTRVTLGGQPLAQPHTQTLGAGEIGYLTYELNARAHVLLRNRAGNQLGARVTVTTAAPSSTGGAAITAQSKTTTAFVSLDSFR